MTLSTDSYIHIYGNSFMKKPVLSIQITCDDLPSLRASTSIATWIRSHIVIATFHGSSAIKLNFSISLVDFNAPILSAYGISLIKYRKIWHLCLYRSVGIGSLVTVSSRIFVSFFFIIIPSCLSACLFFFYFFWSVSSLALERSKHFFIRVLQAPLLTPRRLIYIIFMLLEY